MYIVEIELIGVLILRTDLLIPDDCKDSLS